jgi:dTDP-4-amino-4,6-dideoxygalactose transaminase
MIKTINFSEVNPISNTENLAIKNEIYTTIKKKNFILGDPVNKFENEFSKLSGIKYSVGCGSGTDALILALMSLNLKSTDEVVVPGMSYISTALSVILNNNKLVIADIDNKTGLISLERITSKITKNTKVIIPVNLYGQKVNLKELRKIVGKNIYILEDSAQSHFAFSCYDCPNILLNKCCKKKKNEKFADISCYSFYPAKNLGAYGDAGLIATTNKKFYKRLLAIRNLGAIKKNKHIILGKNSRLDTKQAIVLRKKLKSILRLNEDRRRIARYYDENLKIIKEIKLTKTNPGSSRHLYIIRTKRRDSLMKYLLKNKISCQIHYPYSLNKLKPFRKIIKRNNNLKNSEKWSNECLSLPMHSKMKLNEARRVVSKINKFFL